MRGPERARGAELRSVWAQAMVSLATTSPLLSQPAPLSFPSFSLSSNHTIACARTERHVVHACVPSQSVMNAASYHGCSPSPASGACGNCARWERAWEFLSEMRERGLEPDAGWLPGTRAVPGARHRPPLAPQARWRPAWTPAQLVPQAGPTLAAQLTDTPRAQLTIKRPAVSAAAPPRPPRR